MRNHKFYFGEFPPTVPKTRKEISEMPESKQMEYMWEKLKSFNVALPIVWHDTNYNKTKLYNTDLERWEIIVYD